MILNHILNVMLDFAVKVHSGQMSSDDDYSEHVFRGYLSFDRAIFQKWPRAKQQLRKELKGVTSTKLIPVVNKKRQYSFQSHTVVS